MPDAAPDALLTAFLTVHAQGAPLPAALYGKGEALWRDWREKPPHGPLWGRFLVALGELAAEHLHDERAAFGHFQAALARAQATGDAEVGAAAAFNLGVMAERKQDLTRARQIYREATSAVARHGDDAWNAPALRCVDGLARLAIHLDDRLDPAEAALLKQAWLAWLSGGVDGIDADLDDRLTRTLAALLLPEDDPTQLAARWRAWPPHALGDHRDDSPTCLLALYDAAIRAAERHLSDEEDAAAPYRALKAAALRTWPVPPSSSA